MNPFRLHLLGKPSIALDGSLLAGLPKKAFVIAALTSRASPRSLSKADVASRFWPGLLPLQRANNLRQLMFRVRKFELRHNATLFESDDREISLSATVRCDVVELEDVWSVTRTGIETLLDSYRGPLLHGYDAGDHALKLWLSEQRLQIEERFVDIILAVTEKMPSELRKNSLQGAIQVAPATIGLRKALMRQLIADGSTSEARRLYREIRHIGGHGAVSMPPELGPDAGMLPARPISSTAVPLAQFGRDQAGVPKLVLLPPRAGSGENVELPLADALVDDVTVALTRLRSVSVLAAHTARRIADGEDHRGLGLARADFILRTKLRAGGARSGGAFPRLTLTLEKAATGDIVWADGIGLDREEGPMHFAALANGIALTLVDQIERSTLRAFQVPADAGAYGHYLVGQSALQMLDLPGIRRARASFKAALVSAPHFAPAYTGIAQSMIYEWVTRGRGDMELVVQARQAAERARDIDPLFGGAHQMLGRASLFEGDFSTSLAHFEQAEALNPHHADLLCDFADTLMHSSFPERADEKIELALRLNPLAPDAYWWASAGIKFFVGEYEGALDHLKKVKNTAPVLRLTAACAAMAGQHEVAKVARNQFLASDPGFSLDGWISFLPVRDPAHRRQYRQALEKAGFK